MLIRMADDFNHIHPILLRKREKGRYDLTLELSFKRGSKLGFSACKGVSVCLMKVDNGGPIMLRSPSFQSLKY